MTVANVACPYCGAAPMRGCSSVGNPKGSFAAKTHKARFKAAGIDNPTHADSRRADAEFIAARQRYRENLYRRPPWLTP